MRAAHGGHNLKAAVPCGQMVTGNRRAWKVLDKPHVLGAAGVLAYESGAWKVKGSAREALTGQQRMPKSHDGERPGQRQCPLRVRVRLWWQSPGRAGVTPLSGLSNLTVTSRLHQITRTLWTDACSPRSHVSKS